LVCKKHSNTKKPLSSNPTLFEVPDRYIMGNTVGWTGADFDGALEGWPEVAELEPPIPVADGVDGVADEVEHAEVGVFRRPEAQVTKRYMCKHMKRKRFCRFGESCKFAHTRAELCIPLAQFYQRRNVRMRPIPSTADRATSTP
jgi:hypothetical protein